MKKWNSIIKYPNLNKLQRNQWKKGKRWRKNMRKKNKNEYFTIKRRSKILKMMQLFSKQKANRMIKCSNYKRENNISLNFLIKSRLKFYHYQGVLQMNKKNTIYLRFQERKTLKLLLSTKRPEMVGQQKIFIKDVMAKDLLSLSLRLAIIIVLVALQMLHGPLLVS